MKRPIILPVFLGLAGVVVMLAMLREARAFTFTYPGCGSTLQACINAASPGDTIQIQAGTYITSVTLSKPVSLVGAGATGTIIRALPNQRVLTVTGAAISNTVVISGLTLVGGNITGTTCIQSCGGALQITGTARPLLQFLVISNSVAAAPNLNGGLGGGLYVHTGSPLTLLNVTVISNTSINNSGGGMYAASPVTLTNVVIALNRAPNGAGGGLRAADAVQMTGGSFIRNHSFNPGGGARVTGLLNAVGTLVMNNSAGIEVANPNPINGGGLRADADAALTSVRLDTNRVNNNGGGVYASGRLTMSNMVIIDNEAAKDGGGAYSTLTANLNSVSYIGNSAGNAGGGLFALADAALTGASFFSNTAVFTGGGAYLNGSATGSLNTFEKNRAQTAGGVHAQGALDWSGASFLANTATQRDGGGLYAASGVTLDEAQFTGNVAKRAGGGLLAAGAITVTGSRFESNETILALVSGITGRGGGIYAGAGPVVLAGNVFTDNVAGTSGAAARLVDAEIDGDRYLSNRANSEGGALFVSGDVSIHNSVFDGNQSLVSGAIVADTSGGVGVLTVVNSRFTGNRADNGTGADVLRLFDTDTHLIHSTLTDGDATTAPAIAAARSSVLMTNTIVVSHLLVFANLQTATLTEDYNLYFNSTLPSFVITGSHSITGEPRFVDPAGDDYRLGAGSPAIDAGVDAGITTDFEGDARPEGAGFDIGFDERAFVAPTPTPGPTDNRVYLPIVTRVDN